MSYDAWKLDNGEPFPNRCPCGGYVNRDDWDDIRQAAHDQLAKSLDAYDPELDHDRGNSSLEVTVKMTIRDIVPDATDQESFSETGYLPPGDRDMRPDVIAALEEIIAAVRRDMAERP